MILQLEIPQIAKQYAWLFLAQNNMGNRGHFDGDRNRQYTGLLGEICFKKLITGYWPTLKGGYDGGFDIELDGLKADVKTMGRKVPVSSDFVHNFVLAQAHLDAEVLIFQSLIKDSSTLEVCGWISKEDALAFGTEYPKGTIRKRRDGSTFQTQAALLEVEQRFLNPFRGHLAFNLESSQLSGPLFAPAQ